MLQDISEASNDSYKQDNAVPGNADFQKQTKLNFHPR